MPCWPSWLRLQSHLPKREGFRRHPCHAKRCLCHCHIGAEGILLVFFSSRTDIKCQRRQLAFKQPMLSEGTSSMATAGEAGRMQMRAKLCTGGLTSRKTPCSGIYPPPAAPGGRRRLGAEAPRKGALKSTHGHPRGHGSVLGSDSRQRALWHGLCGNCPLGVAARRMQPGGDTRRRRTAPATTVPCRDAGFSHLQPPYLSGATQGTPAVPSPPPPSPPEVARFRPPILLLDSTPVRPMTAPSG